MKKVLKLYMCVLIFMICFVQNTMHIDAEGSRTGFGSNEYTWNIGETSQIRAYLKSDLAMANMQMDVVYNDEMLEYHSGGELVQAGIVRISSDNGEDEANEMLEFIPKISGNTTISIKDAYIINGSGERSDIQGVSVNVSIPMQDGCALNGISVNEDLITNFEPGVLSYDFEVKNEVENINIAAEPSNTGSQVEISNTELNVGQNEINITVTNTKGIKGRYTLYITRAERIETESEAEESESGNVSEPTIVVEGNKSASLRNQILFIALIIFLVFVLIYLVHMKLKMNRSVKKVNNAHHKNEKLSKKYVENLDENEDFDNLEEFDYLGEQEDEIVVKNVTMSFKREKDEPTSLKESLVRTLKRQRSYEMFQALDDVSFRIKKGEVIGIIGTNGSGKSTLLKIISGALEPTSGTVEVDSKKVQLLTLGTGFDHELTGKENVYLNGSIIGYTKEYIDKKYNEIVEFAELQGFMEEKVRNYSTGMVSRLGFAIATTREAPGILILDEVLSVGDMFFRQKSEARIKEMIQSGSTVLIVSHSPSVIRTTCNRAVWIEKGILQLIGNSKDVCIAYESMNK